MDKKIIEWLDEITEEQAIDSELEGDSDAEDDVPFSGKFISKYISAIGLIILVCVIVGNNFLCLVSIVDCLFAIVVSTSDYLLRGPGFDSWLYPIIFIEV